MSFESIVARRYLKIRHQRRIVPLITILATVGVAVGVMVLVVVIAVMSGFRSELEKRILGMEAHAIVLRYNQWISDYHEVMTQIEAVQGVASASPFVHAQGMLRSASSVSGIMLRGIDPQSSHIQAYTLGEMDLPQLLTLSENKQDVAGVVLGAVLADKLNMKTGDTALLTVVGSQHSQERQLPRMLRLKIIGLYETGMHQYDGTMAFMNIHQLQQMIGVVDQVTGIEVRMDNIKAVDDITPMILSALGMQYWATHWKHMNRNLFSMLTLQKIVMYIILTLIIVVAAFNITGALMMMVKEKTKDIAILKAMGATSSSIRKIFIGKGLAIGLLGVALGVCSGLVVCLLLTQYQFIDLPGDVYFLTTLPVQITVMDMVVIVLGTLGICIFATLYPSGRAADLNPVDAIRYG